MMIALLEGQEPIIVVLCHKEADEPRKRLISYWGQF